MAGDLHDGEGKPSCAYLTISKYTPEEDKACIQYGCQRKATDKQLCMKRHRQL